MMASLTNYKLYRMMREKYYSIHVVQGMTTLKMYVDEIVEGNNFFLSLIRFL